MSAGLSSQQVREQLDHPVIDADGHVLEFMPAALPYLRESLGPKLFEQYRSQTSPIGRILGGASPAEREQTRAPQSAWWGNPAAKTIDLATASDPRTPARAAARARHRLLRALPDENPWHCRG